MSTESRDAHTENNVNPGLKLFVWPKAYVYAAQRVVDKVFEEGALNNAYRSRIQSNVAQVTQLVKPTLRVEINGSKLIWMLDNASVTVRGQSRNHNGEENLEKRLSGSFEINITVQSGPFFNPIYSAKVNCTNLSFSSSSRSNSSNVIDIGNGNSSNSVNVSSHSRSRNSRKRTSSEVVTNSSCSFMSSSSTKRSRNNVTISGGNHSIKRSGSASDNDLGETLVSALTNAVLESLNDHHLPDYWFPIGSSCDWMFDFSGAMPKFQNGYLGATHLGAFQDVGKVTNSMPVQALPLPESQNSGRMLTIFISDYVFNTIGDYSHRHKVLSYNLTQADLVAQAPQDNSAINTSGKTRCLSDCFPDFSVKYPGAAIEVIMASTEAPTSTFSGQNLEVSLLGSAIFRAHLPDGSLVNFLTAEVRLETTVQLMLNLDKLMGTVTSIIPKSIAVVKSTLKSLNREVLKEAFDLIASQFLRRKFEEITENGIPIPRPLLSRVEEFQNIEMSTADYLLRIDTDLKFHA